MQNRRHAEDDADRCTDLVAWRGKMSKLRIKDIVTVDSVRTANTRLIAREASTGRFVDRSPSTKGWIVVRERTTVRGDIATAGKVAMGKYIKEKA